MSRGKRVSTHQKKAIRPNLVPAQPKDNRWVEMIADYIQNPIRFVKEQIGVTPDPWQAEALNALSTDDMIAIRSGHGVGKCKSLSDDVLLADGRYVKAGDLIGATANVLSWEDDGSITTNRAYFTDNGVKPIWRITTSMGRVLERTGNHPLLTIKGWENVEDLRAGDSIAMPTFLPVEGNHRMDEDELKVIAYLVGDGGLTSSALTMNKRDSPQVREFEASCRRLGRTLSAVDEECTSFRVVDANGVNPVTRILRKHGLMDKGAHDKFIPEAVFTAPNDQVAMFLNRLFSTEGWATSNRKANRIEIGYTSASRRLALDIQRLMLRFGIVGRIWEKKVDGKREESTAWSWGIHSSEDVLKFVSEIGSFGKENADSECIEAAECRDLGQSCACGYRTWPEEALSMMLEAARDQGIPLSKSREGFGVRCRGDRCNGIPKDKVRKALRVVDVPGLKALSDAGIGWDIIESIEFVGEQPTVCVSVPGPETYIVDHIEHNSSFQSWAVLFFLFTRPHPRVPCTAPGRPQLQDVLWPEIAKWLQQSRFAPMFRWTKTRIYRVGHEETWFATQRTAATPEGLQGFHADHQLWVMDEASGIEDEFMDVIEGSSTGGKENKILMTGNPTQLSGFFHRAFHRDVDLYKTIHVSCVDSPRVSRRYIERMRRFGEESDIYRVRVLGEFPRAGLDTFLPYGEVQKATHRNIPEGVPVEMGIDVARQGHNHTVFAIRKGMKLLPLDVRSKWDTVRTADHAVELIHEHGVSSVKVDDTGVGGGVTDNLRRLKREKKIPRHVAIVPVNNSGTGDDFYDNTGALSWGHFRELLPHISIPEDDEQLFLELTDRRERMTKRGKIALEPKEDMRARGGHSPDRADATILAFFEAEVPAIDPDAINRALSFSTRGLWTQSKWRRAV